MKTTVGLANGGEMLLDYRMHYTDARWQVYDVNIEGVSLVANYRGQFDKIVRPRRTSPWSRDSGHNRGPRR